MIRRHQNLVLGLALIAVGGLFLLNAIGVPVLRHLWKAWPLVLVAAGAHRLSLRRAGHALAFPAPERVLLILVTVAGLITTFTRGRNTYGSESEFEPGLPPPPPPPGFHPPVPFVPHEIKRLSVPLGPGNQATFEIAGADLSIGEGDGAEVQVILSSSLPSSLPGRVQLSSGDHGAELDFDRGSAPAPIHFRLEVQVPATAQLRVHHRDGRLEARAFASLDLEASGSEISLDSILQGVKVKCENGRVEARNLGGGIEVAATTSNVLLASVAGRSVVHSVSGNIEISDVAGEAEVTGSDGFISVQDVAGKLRLEATRATVEIGSIGDGAEIQAHDSMIKLSEVQGSVVLRGTDTGATLSDVAVVDASTTLRALVLSDVTGSARVQIEDADVVIKDSGPVEVKALRGSARLNDVHGSIRLEIEDGDAWVEDFGQATLTAEVTRGNVSLALGEGESARLELQADPGRILAEARSALPIKESGPTATLETGVRGGGRPVKVVVHHGFIRLKD